MATWINASINQSPVINAVTASDMSNVAHRAIKFDASGKAILAGSGDVPIGLLVSSMDGELPAGSDVSVQVKDIGYIEMAGDIDLGDAVTVTDSGKGIKAVSGSFILGYSLSKGEDGSHVQIQITKSGYMI